MKRAFDIIFSSIGIICLFPVFLMVSLAIYLESKGGIFFFQERIGRYKKPFQLVKFRTMRKGSAALGLITIGDRDSRVTRVGYYLRKYKLDELPQFINILIGEMSFVGPRPEVRRYVDMYNFEQLKVLTVRPGVTDYASIKYRNESELLAEVSDPEKYYVEFIMPEKIKLNIIYVENNSIFIDVKILYLTLVAILKG